MEIHVCIRCSEPLTKTASRTDELGRMSNNLHGTVSVDKFKFMLTERRELWYLTPSTMS